MVVVVGLHCDIISCKLARQGVRHGVAEGSGRVQHMWTWYNAVGLTSILDQEQSF